MNIFRYILAHADRFPFADEGEGIVVTPDVVEFPRSINTNAVLHFAVWLPVLPNGVPSFFKSVT
jgi:hypothetical protein